MPLRNTISNLHRNHKRSVTENLNWYNDTLSNKDSFGVYSVPANQYLKPGKIYRFYYNPVNHKDLTFYDINPLVISLGSTVFQGRTVDVCLNLNYFPYDVKVYIINSIYKAYRNIIDYQIRRYPDNAKLQKYYELTYDVLNGLFGGLNITFGIRNYFREKRTKTASISYDNFYRIPFIEEYNFKKMNVRQIHNIYLKSLKK